MAKNVTFITSNQHKADALARVLGLSLAHRAVDLMEIQSTSLEEIVEHKVRQAYIVAKCPVLVEDVALEFMALGGLPGPFIKFFVEAPNGLENLCRMLDGFDDRSAVAACVCLATTMVSRSNCSALNLVVSSPSILWATAVLAGIVYFARMAMMAKRAPN